MKNNLIKIKDLLLINPLNQGEIASRIELSQPQVSNYLRTNPEAFLKVGRARATRFYLRRVIFGESRWPIYQVNAVGQAEYFADLYSVYPGQGFIAYLHQQKSWEFYDCVPWWMADLQPQGFLGRALARRLTNVISNLSPDPREWSQTNILQILVKHPHDTVGNLLIGPIAYDLWLNESPVSTVQLADLPTLAEQAIAGWFGGSSAGGEQPKFACTINEPTNRCLVKFTACVTGNVNAQRWADLLISEHMALSVLSKAGISAASSELVRIAERQFLIIKRFDREGHAGRLGIVSLKILDAEFVGSHSQRWPAIAELLVKESVVRIKDIPTIQLLFCFGQLIANTDMHSGNLSFIHDGCRPLALAPVYDMLPMFYAPNSNGEMNQCIAPIAIDSQLSGDIWRQALTLALLFWQSLSEVADLSDSFKEIAKQMRQYLQNDVAQKIMRMA